MTLGVGFFSVGTEIRYIDMFVSDDEIAFCDAQSHRTDDCFMRIPAEAIYALNIVAQPKFTRVAISLYDQDYQLTADIPSARYGYSQVEKVCSALKNSVESRKTPTVESVFGTEEEA